MRFTVYNYEKNYDLLFNALNIKLLRNSYFLNH